MHLGVISFCNRVAHNIKSNDIKTEILNEIEQKYNIKIIQKHFFRLTDDSVNHITATPHVVTIRSNGNPYYMYFTKYENKEIIYFIDKKIHPTYQLPRIIINKGLFDENLFNGTLIDGEMVCTYDKNWLFLINDMIAYKGEYMSKYQLPERINLLNNMIENEYTADNPIDMCSYVIKPYYNLCCDTLDKIHTFNYNFSIRGIYFWAYNLKYKPKLINIDDNVIQNVSIKTKDNPDFILKIDKNKNNPIQKNITTDNTNDYCIKTFIKTDLPDVYKIKEDSKLAYVKSIDISHMLRTQFINQSSNFTKQFKCYLDSKFDKWVPIEPI
jgi:hypothetical protein